MKWIPVILVFPAHKLVSILKESSLWESLWKGIILSYINEKMRQKAPSPHPESQGTGMWPRIEQLDASRKNFETRISDIKMKWE